MSEPSDSTAVKGRKRLFMVFVIAVFGIGLAVGSAVYTWMLSEQVRSSKVEMVEASQRFGELVKLSDQVEFLRQEQAAMLNVKAELDAYRTQLIAQLEKLSGVYQDEWLVEEAANYVRMAEQRLLLGQDPAGATTFLAAADEVLGRVALIGTNHARRALANDMLELSRAGLDNAVRERAMFMVDALLEQAGDLSMRSPPWEWTYGSRSRGAEVDASSGTQPPVGLISGIKGFLYSMVTVRRHAPGRPLVAEPQMRIYFEQNYRMLLQHLLVSALKNDGKAFQRGVDRTRAWLDEFFDPKDQLVVAARLQLQSMDDLEWNAMPVDLSRSRQAIAVLHQSWKTASGAPPPMKGNDQEDVE